MVVFFKNVFNYFHHRKKIQIVQNTQSTVYTNTSLTIFRIGRIQHWDICLFTCSVCIGVSNAKHGMGHALSVRVIHKKSSEVHKHNLTSIKFLFYSDETINTGMLH